MASQVHRLSTAASGPPTAPHVVLVTNQFPTPVEPERGVFTLQLARRLARRGRLTVICPLPWFPRVPLLRGAARWYRFAGVPDTWMQDGIRILSPKYPLVPRVSERFHARLMAARLRPVLRALHRTEGIDLINSHWLYPDSVAVQLATRALEVPHVPTGLGCDVNEFIDDRAKGPQIRAMLSAAAAITVVAESLRRHLVARGVPAERITTIPNGVDAGRFHPRDQGAARRELRLPPDAEYVLYVGRFSEEKAVDVLIEGMATVAQTRPAARLVLVGDGPLRAALAERAAALGISERVRFVGQQSHQRIADWMAAADCLCLPSAREGCPNVVLEALACGVPVVASAVGGIPDMVSDISGILVRPNDPQALARGLGSVLERAWNPLSIAATVATQTWEGVAEAYWTLFRCVLEGRPAPQPVT